jgi:hypothetical protein
MNNQKRFKIIGGFKLDRYIFQGTFLLVIAWLFFVSWHYDFNMNYYSCYSVDPMYQCHNPFYRPATWQNQEYLAPGEYGTKVGPLFDSVYWVPTLFLALAFMLNWRWHNKGKKIEVAA